MEDKIMCNREKWRNFVYYRKKYEKSTKYYVNQFCIKIHMPYAYKNVYKHVDNVDNLFAKELFTNIYNVSGAHSYQQITMCTTF